MSFKLGLRMGSQETQPVCGLRTRWTNAAVCHYSNLLSKMHFQASKRRAGGWEWPIMGSYLCASPKLKRAAKPAAEKICEEYYTGPVNIHSWFSKPWWRGYFLTPVTCWLYLFIVPLILTGIKMVSGLLNSGMDQFFSFLFYTIIENW